MSRRTSAVALALALIFAAGCGPKERKVVAPKPAKLAERCDLSATPLSREQALCVARAAKVGMTDGAFTLEEGTALGEAIWILRETCDARNPPCVEIWIRRSDGAIVNTRYLHAFEGYDSLPR